MNSCGAICAQTEAEMNRTLALSMLLVACPSGKTPKSTPPAVVSVPTGPPLEYRIQWGDTLELIADYYAVPGGYPALASMNDIYDPDWIGAGERLRIPATPRAVAELPAWPTAKPYVPVLEVCATARTLPPPLDSFVSGCERSACVALDGPDQICSCDSQDADTMVWQHAGAIKASWTASIAATPGDEPWQVRGTVTDFEVVRADLDGDGTTEYLAAHRRALDDVGMSTWDVALISPSTGIVSPFELGNYGLGTLVQASGRCDLLATEWTTGHPVDSQATSYFLTGRLLSWRDGQLHGASLGTLGRRLLYSFEPGSVSNGGTLMVGTPLADLNAGPTEVRQRDLAVHYPMAGPSRRVLGLRGDILLVDSNGSTDELPTRQMRFGDRLTATLFPRGYRPATDLTGVGATLQTYHAGWSGARTVVWIDG
jgi:hypothetical protein